MLVPERAVKIWISRRPGKSTREIPRVLEISRNTVCSQFTRRRIAALRARSSAPAGAIIFRSYLVHVREKKSNADADYPVRCAIRMLDKIVRANL